MWTVHQISEMTGVSVRALHHYDAIGLLKPCSATEAGYRLYDEADLERLGQILLLKELDFSLRQIAEILSDPHFDRAQALDRQIDLLTLKKKRIENIISFAEQIKTTGVYHMDFKVFDRQKIEAYAAEAKKQWGSTEAYREYIEKTAERSEEDERMFGREMMQLFVEFGMIKDRDPAGADAQKLVSKLQTFITEHYYNCTKPILSGLGQMYAAGGEMTDNIDAAGGDGTAVFAASAIAAYCK